MSLFLGGTPLRKGPIIRSRRGINLVADFEPWRHADVARQQVRPHKWFSLRGLRFYDNPSMYLVFFIVWFSFPRRIFVDPDCAGHSSNNYGMIQKYNWNSSTRTKSLHSSLFTLDIAYLGIGPIPSLPLIQLLMRCESPIIRLSYPILRYQRTSDKQGHVSPPQFRGISDPPNWFWIPQIEPKKKALFCLNLGSIRGECSPLPLTLDTSDRCAVATPRIPLYLRSEYPATTNLRVYLYSMFPPRPHFDTETWQNTIWW